MLYATMRIGNNCEYFLFQSIGDMTTSFVMVTFAEWFTNSTFDTIRKNLRTTTGRHKIEIDENILSKYIV